MRFMPTLLAAATVACGFGVSTAMADTQITGAGSTFDYPFFSKAFQAYSKAHPDVTVSYEAIGSGGGIQQFTAKSVDFGASDVPMNADELAEAKAPVVEIPVTLGGERIQSPRNFQGSQINPRGGRRHLSRPDNEME